MVAALWLLAGVLLFARTVNRALNHDEHQFLAPGALLANEGLLPYRDYPLFHLPNLVFAYAALDRITGQPILAPKLLSFAATWLATGAILLVALRRGEGILIATGLLLLLLYDPLFLYASGKTWNHEVPTCLLVFALIFHLRASDRNSLPSLLLSGFLSGLAVGCRLTFAPCLLPLLGAVGFFPFPRERRWFMAASFTASVTLALSPSLYFLATSTESFLFGNLEFPRLRLLDPENVRIRRTLTLGRKLRYFAKEVVIPSWPVFTAFAAFAIPAIRRRLGCETCPPAGLRLAASVALFLLLGCFLPSRYQYQHFFALIPVLTLGVAFASPFADFRAQILFLLFAISCGVKAYVFSEGSAPHFPIAVLRQPQGWFSAEATGDGLEIRQHVPTGRILTLAPAYPLAGGLAIYPEFATGPFAWRSARFVAPERRPRLHIVAPADLEAFLALHPPAAILTGFETSELEAPLVAYAQSHGFRLVKLSRKRHVWLPQ